MRVEHMKENELLFVMCDGGGHLLERQTLWMIMV
jgi:hypothetical protein